jgi:hypothetical protein
MPLTKAPALYGEMDIDCSSRQFGGNIKLFLNPLD